MSRALYHLSYGTAVAEAYLAVWTRAFSLRFFRRCLAIATRLRLFMVLRYGSVTKRRSRAEIREGGGRIYGLDRRGHPDP
jgi:hypothetical protein